MNPPREPETPAPFTPFTPEPGKPAPRRERPLRERPLRERLLEFFGVTARAHRLRFLAAQLSVDGRAANQNGLRKHVLRPLIASGDVCQEGSGADAWYSLTPKGNQTWLRTVTQRSTEFSTDPCTERGARYGPSLGKNEVKISSSPVFLPEDSVRGLERTQLFEFVLQALRELLAESGAELGKRTTAPRGERKKPPLPEIDWQTPGLKEAVDARFLEYRATGKKIKSEEGLKATIAAGLLQGQPTSEGPRAPEHVVAPLRRVNASGLPDDVVAAIEARARELARERSGPSASPWATDVEYRIARDELVRDERRRRDAS